MDTADHCDEPRRWRSRTHFWLDLVTALAFSGMAGTGMLQRWVLPPGSGRGGATWLGLGRHDWGDVHFWLAAVLFGLVVVHLALHWAWIRACWGRLLGSLRSPLTWLVLLGLLTIMVLPFLIPARDGDGSPDGPREGRGVHRPWRR